MKKLCRKAIAAAAVMMAVSSNMGVFALPEFDGAYVFVRDGVADKMGKVAKKPPKDQIRINNATGEGIDNAISVYGYFKPLQSWTFVGGMDNLAAGVDTLLKISDEHPLSHYTALALVVDGMTAEAAIERAGDDLRIYIKSLTPMEGEAATPKMNNAVLCYGDGAEDWVRPNNLGDKTMTLRVWAYDKKQAAWQTLCTIPDLAPGEARKVNTEYKGDLDQFDTFAIYETTNMKIECRAEEIKDDLILSVSAAEDLSTKNTIKDGSASDNETAE